MKIKAEKIKLPSIEKIFEKLANVYDPELMINIVDLGLVNDVQVDKGKVFIELTLTSPYCPAGENIKKEAIKEIKKLKEVKYVSIKFIWNPPWGPEKMSEAARLELGYAI
jgi:metal-sulfur cluster biosynthetic enzyme